MPRIAHYTTVAVCPNGCPVLVLSDENHEDIVEAHISPELLETLIADLRLALAEGAVMQRPPG